MTPAEAAAADDRPDEGRGGGPGGGRRGTGRRRGLGPGGRSCGPGGGRDPGPRAPPTRGRRTRRQTCPWPLQESDAALSPAPAESLAPTGQADGRVTDAAAATDGTAAEPPAPAPASGNGEAEAAPAAPAAGEGAAAAAAGRRPGPPAQRPGRGGAGAGRGRPGPDLPGADRRDGGRGLLGQPGRPDPVRHSLLRFIARGHHQGRRGRASARPAAACSPWPRIVSPGPPAATCAGTGGPGFDESGPALPRRGGPAPTRCAPPGPLSGRAGRPTAAAACASPGPRRSAAAATRGWGRGRAASAAGTAPPPAGPGPATSRFITWLTRAPTHVAQPRQLRVVLDHAGLQQPLEADAPAPSAATRRGTRPGSGAGRGGSGPTRNSLRPRLRLEMHLALDRQRRRHALRPSSRPANSSASAWMPSGWKVMATWPRAPS